MKTYVMSKEIKSLKFVPDICAAVYLKDRFKSDASNKSTLFEKGR